MNVQEFLKEKGLSIGEIMGVRTEIRKETQDYHPNIAKENKKVLIGAERLEVCWYVDCRELSSMRFKTEIEAILAQALFLNIENFNINAFRYEFGHVCRLIGAQNEWT